MSEIRTCQHCESRVIPKQDDTCPSCGASFAEAPVLNAPAVNAAATAMDPENPYAAPIDSANASKSVVQVFSIVGGVLSALVFVFITIGLFISFMLRPLPPLGVDMLPHLTGTFCGAVLMLGPPGYATSCFFRYRWKAGLITMLCFFGAYAAFIVAIIMLAPR